jgi:hypothetical protein
VAASALSKSNRWSTKYQAELRRERAGERAAKAPPASFWHQHGCAQSRHASIVGNACGGDEQKLAIVMETKQPGATVSGVAHKRGILTGILFRRRAEFGVAQKKHKARFRRAGKRHRGHAPFATA